MAVVLKEGEEVTFRFTPEDKADQVTNAPVTFTVDNPAGSLTDHGDGTATVAHSGAAGAVKLTGSVTPEDGSAVITAEADLTLDPDVTTQLVVAEGTPAPIGSSTAPPAVEGTTAPPASGGTITPPAPTATQPLYTYQGTGTPDPTQWTDTGQTDAAGAELYTFHQDVPGGPAMGVSADWAEYTAPA